MKFIYAIAGLFLLASCKKEDASKPTITVTSPTNQQTFANGQTVNVTATIADDGELHSVYLKVINTTNNAHVVHFEEHIDVKSYNLNKSFTAQTGGVYAIEIAGEDHGGNKTTQTIQVRAQ